MRRSSLLLLTLLCVAIPFGSPAPARESNPVHGHGPRTDGPARVIVKFRTGVEAAGSGRVQAKAVVHPVVAALAARTQLSVQESHPIAGNVHVIQLTPQSAGESLDATLARLRADATVEYAEADVRRYAHAAVNDPLFAANQWYLQNLPTTPAAINAESAWDSTTGSTGIVIAELDTGVRFDHPDLLGANVSGRLLPGYDFIADPSVANDGDGRDADASDPGDWVTSADIKTAQFSTCTAGNSSWHGTRVAGILGALTNNSTGIAGITWQGWILPVRVLGKCGGYDSDIIPAMLWAAGIHVDGVPDNPYPAQIVNMSLGSSTSCSAAYTDAISQLSARGVLVVASAGNEGGPVDTPANCPGVAGIAGLRHIGTKVGYSSLGPEVALSAPAGNCGTTSGACVYSIGTTTNLGTNGPGTNSYTDQVNYNVGTSFSAPIVAGIAGLMKSLNGNLSGAQLIARLREGAIKPFPTSPDPSVPSCHPPTSNTDTSQNSECNCTTSTCGAGMANAPGALQAALRPIAAIAAPATVAAGQNVLLNGAGSAAACGHTVKTWSWTNLNTHGVVSNSSSATVVAPASGSFTVELTVTDDAGLTDTADVVVSSASATTAAPASAGTSACLPALAFVSVSVQPSSSSVVVGATQQFTSTVAAADTDVTWQVNGATGGNATVGTISGSGLYTAPASVPSPANVTITAISKADPTRAGTAQVTVIVTPPPTNSPVSGSGSSSGTSTTAGTGATGGSGGGGSLDVLTALVIAVLLANRARSSVPSRTRHAEIPRARTAIRIRLHRDRLR